MGYCASFEDDLIPPDKWAGLYDSMPAECQGVVNDERGPIGIGQNEELGWFIAVAGQGLSLVWAEKKNAEMVKGFNVALLDDTDADFIRKTYRPVGVGKA